MTVANTVRKAGPFLGNGVTTVFPFAFKVFAKGDIAAILTDAAGTELTLGLDSNYSVALNANQDTTPGGSITYPLSGSPMPAGKTLTIIGNMDATQPMDIVNMGRFLPQALENELDRATILYQQALEKVNRALLGPVSETAAQGTLPLVSARLGKVLGFDPVTGKPVVSGSTVAQLDSTVAAVQSAAATITQNGLFLAAGAGAVARGSQEKLRDIVSVKDFGLVGVGNSTGIMQLAHNTGATIFYPAGAYNFTALSIAQGGIIGAGKGQSILVCTDASAADMITYTSNAGLPLFRDFQIQCTVKSSGAGLRINPAAGDCSYATVDNVCFNVCPTGLQIKNASYFKVHNCDFINYAVAGIDLSNTINPDGGDSFISNCLLTSAIGGRGIWHHSSGGLKIINCKILGGNFGYSLDYDGTGNMSDVFIDNCSIEDCTAFGMTFARVSGASLVGAVQITNTEIACISCIAAIAPAFLNSLIISGCTITTLGTTGFDIGIKLFNVNHINIGPCIFNALNGGAAIALYIDSTCTNGKIAQQTYLGHADANCLQNNSTSVYAQPSQQSGTATLPAASTAHGTLFRATVAVVFPVAYKIVPRVECYPGDSAATQVGCYATSITKTGFTLVGIAATTGSVMANNAWVANGII